MVNFPWFPVFERFQGSLQRGKDRLLKAFKGKGQLQHCLTNVKSALSCCDGKLFLCMLVEA